jgi:hypothetical protein
MDLFKIAWSWAFTVIRKKKRIYVRWIENHSIERERGLLYVRILSRLLT